MSFYIISGRHLKCGRLCGVLIRGSDGTGLRFSDEEFDALHHDLSYSGGTQGSHSSLIRSEIFLRTEQVSGIKET